MGLLDDDGYVPPFTPKRATIERAANVRKDNFYALQNLGREEMSQDFEDSPFADRAPLPVEE